MNTIEDIINGTVGDLLGDYSEKIGSEEIASFNHPDNEIIIEILTSLRKIIFPGYFRNRTIKVYMLKNNLSMLLEDVIYKLTKQITIVLGGENEAEITQKAREVTLEFIKRLGKIREYILTDVDAAYEGDPAAYSKDEIIYSYPGLFAMLVNCIAHELFLLNVPIIPRMMTEYAHRETGIDIHPGASILGGNTVIGKDVVIGGSAFITHSVSDGAKVSVKNQELRFNYYASKPVERVNIEEEDNWFYII